MKCNERCQLLKQSLEQRYWPGASPLTVNKHQRCTLPSPRDAWHGSTCDRTRLPIGTHLPIKSATASQPFSSPQTTFYSISPACELHPPLFVYDKLRRCSSQQATRSVMAYPDRVPFLEQLYYHIALPRNVPGHEDRNLRRIEEALLTRLINSSSRLCEQALPEHQCHIRALQDTLVSCRALNVDGMISRSTLLRELRNLSPHKMLVLFASAQNCALLVYEDST